MATFHYCYKRLLKSEKQVLMTQEPLFFYKKFYRLFFGKSHYVPLSFCVITTQHILEFVALFSLGMFWHYFKDTALDQFYFFLIVVTGLLFFTITTDLLPKKWAYKNPLAFLRHTLLPSSFLLTLSLPLSRIFYTILKWTGLKNIFLKTHEQTIFSKEQLLDAITDLDETTLLHENDKKIFTSVLTFHNRIAREIMVPRVDLFCLPHTTSVREAAALPEIKEYSRIPLYKNTRDNIVGILMYKDLLSAYMKYEAAGNDPKFLNISIGDIAKPALYSPETQKIAQLLQEFRKKQSHLAVIVDEYGGTSGIVTIEDILEELVGEISDEYDEEEILFLQHPEGGWIVSGKATLIDLEEETSIRIPQEGDYDTVAGYIFFRLGSIPKKGVKIHHDAFEIEVIKSDERSVETVRIAPSKLLELYTKQPGL